ncbi:mediator of RNA polymerase II transcription subunit 1 isoform X1 [Drosophila pseudoobscura]|uniref:Mediator of RNA polymerase II transcription subunit 1 n=1 Tax=Drosophila pseudoobscura pseudoobscura TaxID=46245 RepID=A0A6I8UD38_DROPS|nr:mediator of RNA polymerase II transcription subunit 1 isoform X1 [Drosophila pseudoobscura]
MSGTNAKCSLGAGGGFGSHIPSIEEKNRQIQQETMMEKLRAKYRNKPKTYEEIKKSVRMYFIEKHYALDPLCKATLQSALDKLQHYIKVTSRHGLVERLESLSRQLGLKFMEDQQLLFISTDMFYVEILLDASGNLSDVKVHHECKIEQQSSELVKCLKSGDFADFTVQLEGLSSIYQLNAEPKVKKKAFVALQAMETDIYSLYSHQMQNRTGDSYDIMNSSAVGLVLQRRGGHPMKLTYFCPPIHLAEGESKLASSEFSIDQVMHSSHGLSATVNLEGSSANKLQIMPILSFSRDPQTGLELPTYAQLNQNNSMLMPATYVLRLNKPMPVCYETLKSLGLPGVEGMAAAPSPPVATVLNLIVQTASKQAIKNTQRGLYVNLPKETHCYFFTDNRKLQGTLISSLPFTEPAQVPKIMTFLKKQALFYTLLASCVREQQKQYNDMDSTVILEVTAVSFNQITVELQHPYEESLATVDFLLEDGQATCSIYCLNNEYEVLSQKLTRTVRKVLSIPMVIYKLLKCWDEEHQFKLHGVIGSGAGAGAGSGAGAGTGNGGGVGTGLAHAHNFNQFAMEAGPSLDGSLPSGGFTSINSLKMEAKSRSLADAFVASTSAAAAIASLINLKRETDPQSALGPVSSGNSSSSGSSSTVLAAAKATDHEIADKYKNIWKDKTPNLKHCVSITPIPGDGKTGGGGAGGGPVGSSVGGVVPTVDVQRTGGIEIIPLNAQSQTSGTRDGGSATTTTAPTTITITPITGKDPAKESSKKSSSSAPAGVSIATKRPHESSTSASSSSAGSGGSSSSTSSTGSSSSCSTDTQKEKKRKKKRDDSPMGPPEKIYSRQNSPAAGGDASATGGVVRKFSSPSSSPKAGGSGQGILSGVPPARPSPKHSPVYSSPKHNTASNSPKSPFGTHSPKHGSSGKPSMSTLKSAATAGTSLSPKGDKSTSSVGPPPSASVGSSTGASANPSLVRSFASVGAPPPPPPVPPLSSAISSSSSSSSSCSSSGSAGGSSSQQSGSSGIKKEKSSAAGPSSSSGASSGPSGGSGGVGGVSPASVVSVASVAAAVAALKTSQQQQQQQQLKSSVASLSHLAAGGSLGSYAAAGGAAAVAAAAATVGAGAGAVTGASALELSALRKGLAGGAVSLMTSTAALATAIPATATAAAAGTGLGLGQGQGLGQGVGTAPSTSAAVGVGVGPAASAGAAPVQAAAPATFQQQQPGAAPPSSCLATSGASSSDGGASNITSGTSSEYMVKPSSQEGLKLTINKTGSSKSSSSGASSSSIGMGKTKGPSSGSSGGASASASSSSYAKKQHTGLKPGVNSGPASKKATASTGGATTSGGASSSSSKHLFQKANSSGNLSSKLSGSASGGGVLLTKSNSTNSFQEHNAPRRRPSMGGLASSGGGAGGAPRKGGSSAGGGSSSGAVSPAALTGSMSQPPPRFDHHTDMMTILQYASPTMAASMEGFIKGLHNKFQIPKLSQRGSGGSGRSTPSSTEQTSTTATSTVVSATTSSALPDPDTKPSAAPPPPGNDLLLNLSTTAPMPSGDGIDEELLASLAGE